MSFDAELAKREKNGEMNINAKEAVPSAVEYSPDSGGASSLPSEPGASYRDNPANPKPNPNPQNADTASTGRVSTDKLMGTSKNPVRISEGL